MNVERASPSLKRDALLLVVKVTFSVVFLLIVFTMVFGLERVRDESMNPSIREGDLVLYYRLQKDYHAGDLIIVDEGDKQSVRRVIATAGDVVDMNENGLLINGYEQQEEYIYTETEPFLEGITFPVTVPEGQVFVLGDDRPISRDSRIYGTVDIRSATRGRVLFALKRRHL